MDLAFTPAAGRAPRPGALVPRGDAVADLGAARRARLDGRVGRRGARRRGPDVPRGGGAPRGGRACAPPRPALVDVLPAPLPRRRRSGRRRVGRGELDARARRRSSPTSTPRPTSRSSAATRSGSSRGSSARCSRRTTCRARSASSRAASPAARSARPRCCPRSVPARSRSSPSRRSAVGQRALELAVEYARTREQFGRIVGTYQAVSHPLANSYLELELARSLAWWAAWCVANDEPDAAVAAAAAKSEAAEAAVAACERAVQAHGGIGFTWEHVLHRLYKRALGIQSWEASSAQLRAEVAESSARRWTDGGGA